MTKSKKQWWETLFDKKYLKYYFLEDYLFNDVNKNFQRRGYLTPEEFFAIVIWKSNRAKTNVRRGIGKSQKTIHTITSEIFRAKTPEQKLNILTSIPSIGIPMASAILTVCYPNDFTIADYRACSSLKDFGGEIIGNPTAKISVYFEYLEKCKELARKYKLSLRNFDRILWAKDFYEGASGLKHLAKGIK
ncbi:MAG: hypothetical protein KY053_02180 [Candidatus Liptonbacteria bacterium]|nr:hypothetical protein [Candidatus Liptonbacteria bacterium]